MPGAAIQSVHRQIIGLGGGGFTREPENLLLDCYLLQQSPQAVPRIGFIGTPGGDAPAYVERFYAAYRRLACRPAHLDPALPAEQMEAWVRRQDIVFVGGGSTRGWLDRWRALGLDRMLRTAWETGLVLSGVSAGTMAWFDQGITRPAPGEFVAMRGMSLLPGSFCPHYSGEPDRRAAFQRMLRDGAISAGYAADDGAALHWIDGALHAAVASSPHARCYRVDLAGGRVREQPLATTYLGHGTAFQPDSP